MMIEQTEPISPDFYLVRIPDDLSFWDNEIAQHLTAINTIFLVDRNAVYHAGDTNGMYQCEPLYSDCEFKEEISQDLYDELWEKVDWGFAESWGSDNVCYFSLSAVDSLFDTKNSFHITDEEISRINQIDKDWKEQYFAFTDKDEKEKYYRVMIDDLREFFLGNRYL
jgi:hypothetical protein